MKDKTEKKNSFLRYLDRIKGKKERGEEVDENSVEELNQFVEEEEKDKSDLVQAEEISSSEQEEVTSQEEVAEAVVPEESDAKEEDLQEEKTEIPSTTIEESPVEIEVEKPTIIFNPVIDEKENKPVAEESPLEDDYFRVYDENGNVTQVWDSEEAYLEAKEYADQPVDENLEKPLDYLTEEQDKASPEIEDIVAEKRSDGEPMVEPAELLEDEQIEKLQAGIGEVISIEDMNDEEELEKKEPTDELERPTNIMDNLPEESIEHPEMESLDPNTKSPEEIGELSVNAEEQEAQMETVPENLFQETSSNMQGKQKKSEESSSTVDKNVNMPILINLIKQAQTLDKTIQKQEEERRKIEQKLQENQDRYRDFLIQIRTMADDQLSSLDAKSTKKI